MMSFIKQHKRIVWIAAIAILLVLPLVVTDAYAIHLAITLGITLMVTIGLNVALGMTGLFSLAQASFFGIGAYVSALLSQYFGFPFWLCLVCGALGAALLGIILGIPCLRLRGDYLAVATLGFAEVVRIILVNWIEVTNGPMGVVGIARPEFFGYQFSGRTPYYYLVLVLLLLIFWLSSRLPKTYLGRNFSAISDDEDVAEYMGVDITRYKVYAFVIGGIFAGIAGSIYAHYLTYISPDAFQFTDSTNYIAMVFLGGVGTVAGPIFGTIVLFLIPELFRSLSEWRMLIVGVMIVAVMVFFPKGIVGSVKDFIIKRKRMRGTSGAASQRK